MYSPKGKYTNSHWSTFRATTGHREAIMAEEWLPMTSQNWSLSPEQLRVTMI